MRPALLDQLGGAVVQWHEITPPELPGARPPAHHDRPDTHWLRRALNPATTRDAAAEAVDRLGHRERLKPSTGTTRRGFPSITSAIGVVPRKLCATHSDGSISGRDGASKSVSSIPNQQYGDGASPNNAKGSISNCSPLDSLSVLRTSCTSRTSPDSRDPDTRPLRCTPGIHARSATNTRTPPACRLGCTRHGRCR